MTNVQGEKLEKMEERFLQFFLAVPIALVVDMLIEKAVLVPWIALDAQRENGVNVSQPPKRPHATLALRGNMGLIVLGPTLKRLAQIVSVVNMCLRWLLTAVTVAKVARRVMRRLNLVRRTAYRACWVVIAMP